MGCGQSNDGGRAERAKYVQEDAPPDELGASIQRLYVETDRRSHDGKKATESSELVQKMSMRVATVKASLLHDINDDPDQFDPGEGPPVSMAFVERFNTWYDQVIVTSVCSAVEDRAAELASLCAPGHHRDSDSSGHTNVLHSPMGSFIQGGLAGGGLGLLSPKTSMYSMSPSHSECTGSGSDRGVTIRNNGETSSMTQSAFSLTAVPEEDISGVVGCFSQAVAVYCQSIREAVEAPRVAHQPASHEDSSKKLNVLSSFRGAGGMSKQGSLLNLLSGSEDSEGELTTVCDDSFPLKEAEPKKSLVGQADSLFTTNIVKQWTVKARPHNTNETVSDSPRTNRESTPRGGPGKPLPENAGVSPAGGKATEVGEAAWQSIDLEDYNVYAKVTLSGVVHRYVEPRRRGRSFFLDLAHQLLLQLKHPHHTPTSGLVKGSPVDFGASIHSITSATDLLPSEELLRSLISNAYSQSAKIQKEWLNLWLARSNGTSTTPGSYAITPGVSHLETNGNGSAMTNELVPPMKLDGEHKEGGEKMASLPTSPDAPRIEVGAPSTAGTSSAPSSSKDK